MCNKQNISQLLSNNSFAQMHTTEHTISSNKYKGEENATTTICTQCKKVLLPFTKNNNNNNNAGTSIRLSNDGDLLANYMEKLQISQSTPHLSHGLCRSCYNNINSDLLSSDSTELINNINNNTNNDRRSNLTKSLSSPQFSRHLPSRPKRVLIVDDNNLQLQIHKRIIEHAGYECDIASSGIQALEFIQKHSYSFILMDLIMSPMDGWTTSKKIKSYLLQSLGFSSSFPKIIAVTGLNIDEKLSKQCFDAGMDDVLHKPISTLMLNKSLHKYSPER